MTKKLILHIPHSSNHIPYNNGYTVNDSKLNQEILLLTDWHTEDLFSNPNHTAIVAQFNRVFCDVERFADDELEVMSKKGMGVTYTHCDDGTSLRNVSNELKTSILKDFYFPHHQKLNDVVKENLLQQGEAFIIDCHSFSNLPFKRDTHQQTPRPDFCIGTDEFHTTTELVQYAENLIKDYGFTVEINTPYSGSIVPMEFYQKDNKVYSIMIEVNRDLYLIPGTNQKSNNYNKVKLFIQDFLEKISTYNFLN